MDDRRRLVTGLGLLLASPLVAHAQPAGKVPRVGLLFYGSPGRSREVDAFRQGLRELRYIEGQNIAIEYRFASGQVERLPGLAAELVRLKVDVIVANSTPAALAAKQATSTIPIVFAVVADAVGAGLIALYVGLIEFLLEFIKPVTLAMRLFGNIFGGEVALGVITALTIALIPAALLLLEGLLNFVQALIFSTLMLMYTIIAVESHEEEHADPEYANLPEGNLGPPLSGAQPAH